MITKEMVVYVCEYDQSEWSDPNACREHEADMAERLHKEYVDSGGRYLFYDSHDTLLLDSTENTKFDPFARALYDKGELMFIAHPSYDYEEIEKFFVIANILGRPCYYNSINMSNMVPHRTLVHNNVSMYRRNRYDVTWNLERLNYMRYVNEETNRAASIRLIWKIKED